MTEIFRNCFIFKSFSTLVPAIQNAWKYSMLGRLSFFLADCYKNSLTKRMWEGFLSAEDTTALSLYGKAFDKIRNLLLIAGRIMGQSLFYRFLCLTREIYYRITRGSIVFRQINRLCLRQWLLAAFALYLPLDYLLRVKTSFGLFASAWEELFILAAILLILWRKALGQSKAIGRETPLDAYIILFMAVGFLLMSLVDPHPYIAMAGYRAQVEYMVWFFLVIRLIENDRDFKTVFYTMLGMGALLALHGIYQYIIAVPIPAGWVSQTEMGVRTRVFSLTGSPNILGSLMVLTAPPAAAMAYYCKKVLTKLMFLGITGAMCLCLLFTFSRGAWVGMVVAVIIFALYMDRRLLGILGAVMAAALIFMPSITSRLTYLFTSDYAEASAVGGRALRWVTGRLLLTESNPWTGFGLGRFGGAVAMNNKLLEETEEFSYFYMDNYYLKTMVEMGYIGIIIFLILLAGLLVWGLRAVYRSGSELAEGTDPLAGAAGNYKAIAAGIFSGLCGVLVHCYFENIFEEPYMMAYFWGLAAMLMYLGFFKEEKSFG